MSQGPHGIVPARVILRVASHLVPLLDATQDATHLYQTDWGSALGGEGLGRADPR